MNNVKTKLAILNFIEFAVWGAYLTSIGLYLSKSGLSGEIGWFFSIQGIASIFMPAIIGIIADRWIPAQRLLGICHAIAGLFMVAAWGYTMMVDQIAFTPLFTLYTISVMFFMPTIGLTNSVNYTVLNKAGLDTVKHFPPIRTIGTVGFICSMLFTDFTGFQFNSYQLLSSGVLSFVLVAYALTVIPNCPCAPKGAEKKSLADALGLRAFTLFKDSQLAIFFIFSMLLGVALQITNGFATPFIESFVKLPEYASNWVARNPTAILSISQASETLCILLIPFFLRRYGIKTVMMMAMLAWVFRFGFFAIGNPGGGLVFLILSMIVYGIAFDFFNVSGSLYIDQRTDSSIRSSAQGLFMLMTNGLGSSIGMIIAQYLVINPLVEVHKTNPEAQADGWHLAWAIFAAYALVVAVLFFFLFKYKHNPEAPTKAQVATVENEPVDAI